MGREEAERQARLRLRASRRPQGIGPGGRDPWLAGVLGQRPAVRAARPEGEPGFTLTVVLSLALGIGANTAIFSLLNAVLLKSAPGGRVRRQLMQLTMGEENGDVFTNPIWESGTPGDAIFTGVSPMATNLQPGRPAARRAGHATYVGGDFFSTLGLAPAAGRLLRSRRLQGLPAVVVLGHGFWQSSLPGGRRHGPDAALDGHPFEIIGVAPPGFSVSKSAEPPALRPALRRGGDSGRTAARSAEHLVASADGAPGAGPVSGPA